MESGRRIAWYAVDVERPAIDVPGLRENLYRLREARRMLYDRESRPYFGDLAEQVGPGKPEFQVLGPPDTRGLLRQLFVVGTFALGPNVLNDGSIIMSEETMAEVFGSWWSDRPAFIAIQLAKGSNVDEVRKELNTALAGRGEVVTLRDFEKRERTYWSRETPVGYITDLGFVMGVMIGMVFIYYAQYQIIRFYLPEYAILKSLGYDWWFFLFMIGQIGAAIITPAFLVAFTLGARRLRRHRGGHASRHDDGPARDGRGAGRLPDHDGRLQPVRHPAPVAGRPHHAVRVTMSTDAQGFGPAVVEAVDVHHHYGEGPQRVDVLFDINMQVREGELVIVTGPSGSGKTTLLTILGTMRKPSEGKLRLLGTDIVGLGGSDLDVLRNRIRFLFQKRNLLSSLTALQNVIAGVSTTPLADPAWDEPRARHLLGMLGLGDKASAWPDELSGGQQQRVAIARTMIGLPDLIIADEPTLGARPRVGAAGGRPAQGSLDARQVRRGAVDPRRAHLRRGLAPPPYRGRPLLRSPHSLSLRAAAPACCCS